MTVKDTPSQRFSLGRPVSWVAALPRGTHLRNTGPSGATERDPEGGEAQEKADRGSVRSGGARPKCPRR